MPEQTPPTQQFVSVKMVKDGVVHLKDGGLRQILIVSGVNFDLKSEEEQTLILNIFQNFLNTLDYPVQFFIHSRKVNIGAYLERMQGFLDKEDNELLKIQIQEYIEFIRSFVKENAIISKTFFVVVPYEPTSVASAASGILGMLGLGGKKAKKTAEQEQEMNIQEQLKQLAQRVNEVTDGLSQVGLRVAKLANDDVIELFYNLYNPRYTEKRGLEIADRK